LNNCAEIAEAKQVSGDISWFVRSQAAGSNLAAGRKEPFVAYVASLAAPPDVDDMRSLEDEFIKDHETSGISAASLILDVNAANRRQNIKDIVAAQAGYQEGPTKFYTLKCTCLTATRSKTARNRSPKIVGYLHFQIHVKELAAVYNISVCHIKVSRLYQRQGLATLLLTSMLQTAETEVGKMHCKKLSLKVAKNNAAALGLYESLGFGYDPKEPNEFLSLEMAVLPTLRSLRKEWQKRLPGVSGGSVEDLSTWWCSNN